MLLTWLILIPFVGGFLCWKSEFFEIKAPRWFALISTGMILIISLIFWLKNFYFSSNFTPASQWQSEINFPWIPRFGINIHLAMDGLSLLMIVMSGFLSIISVLCTWKEVNKYPGFFYLNLMWTLSSVIGIFLAIDMFLFFFFWEVMSIPLYFLIVLWGNKSPNDNARTVAATKFFIYAQTSGFLMLTAVLALVFIHYNATGILTFDYENLLCTPMSHYTEYLIMLGFFVAFVVKIPVVPLHGWLLDVNSQTPLNGSVDLIGFLLKPAPYCLLRFSLPLFPSSSLEFSTIAIWLGIINIFYGAFLAFSQYDIKKLITYSSISHMGFVLIAIYTGSYLAYQGAIVQIIAHSFSAAGLFIFSGQLYEHLHTRDIRMIGKSWNKIKYLPTFFIFFVIATIGLPGTGNFIGEFLILFGTYKVSMTVAMISSFGFVFASIYSLTMLHRIYFGENKNGFSIDKELKEMSLRELLVIFLLIILLVFLGFYPQPIFNTSYCSMNNIHRSFINFLTLTERS